MLADNFQIFHNVLKVFVIKIKKISEVKVLLLRAPRAQKSFLFTGLWNAKSVKFILNVSYLIASSSSLLTCVFHMVRLRPSNRLRGLTKNEQKNPRTRSYPAKTFAVFINERQIREIRDRSITSWCILNSYNISKGRH